MAQPAESKVASSEPEAEVVLDFDATAAPVLEEAGLSGDAAAAAKNKARELVEEMKGDAAGLRDLQMLAASVGAPVVRWLFRHMVTASGVRGADKADALRLIAELPGPDGAGCLRVDFHDVTEKRARTAYLLLDQCPRGHDMGAQLDRLRPRVAPTKWGEVLKHLSSLLVMGRSVYARVARENEPFLRRHMGDRWREALNTRVDLANTTVYIDPAWPNRVGIYVKFEGEALAGSDAWAGDA